MPFITNQAGLLLNNRPGTLYGGDMPVHVPVATFRRIS